MTSVVSAEAFINISHPNNGVTKDGVIESMQRTVGIQMDENAYPAVEYYVYVLHINYILTLLLFTIRNNSIIRIKFFTH